MLCPDDQRALVARADGASVCPSCQGAWLGEVELEALAPGVVAQLALETREGSGAFTKVCVCPECSAPLAPWRMAKLEAWLERCPACERYWAQKQDLRSLEMMGRQAARERAMKSLSPQERKEFASALAQSVVVEEPAPELTPVQLALMFVGIPSVTRLSGNRVPWATWTLAAVIVAVFLLGRVDEEAFGAFALAHEPLGGDAWSLFTATFAHFGWLHLLGNVAFLMAFGDGVEQRVPRWALAFAFVVVSPVFTWVEAEIGEGGAIGGASGGVAMVMGACVVLQSKAKVWFLLAGRLPIHVPILGFAAFWFVYQVGMAAIGVAGVAWWAHLSGLATGVAAGLAVKWGRVTGVAALRT